jgi:hypothetical protein
MNLFLRLLLLFLTVPFRPRRELFAPARKRFIVWPPDLDVLFHVNNGVYLSMPDVARVDLRRLSTPLRAPRPSPTVVSRVRGHVILRDTGHPMRLKVRPLHVVLGAGALLLCLGAAFVLWVLSGIVFGSPSRTTNTDSDSIASSRERLAFVSRYVPLRASATDASFQIVFHDNGQGLPGPSDWEIAVALRVNPADRGRWLDGARPGTIADATGAFSKQPRRTIPSSWAVSSAGEIYFSTGAWLVWHPEGVLEYSSTTF